VVAALARQGSGLEIPVLTPIGAWEAVDVDLTPAPLLVPALSEGPPEPSVPVDLELTPDPRPVPVSSPRHDPVTEERRLDGLLLAEAARERDLVDALSDLGAPEPLGPPASSPLLDATSDTPALRASLVEDTTLPDLSAEAWLRASSELVRPRSLPPEVVERASIPPEPVPLTRRASGRRSPSGEASVSEGAAELLEEERRFSRATSAILRASTVPTFDDEPLPLTTRAAGAAPPRIILGREEAPPLELLQGPSLDAEGRFVAAASGPRTPGRPGAAMEPQALRTPMEEALAGLDDADPIRREASAQRLFAFGVEVLPRLAERFPGPLDVAPLAPGAPLPPFAHCGPLLGLLERLGRDAQPVAAAKLDAPDPVARFFAVYFHAAVFAPEAIPRLLPRLHDEEKRISLLTARTLFGYRDHPGFGAVLDHLHGRLANAPQGARRHAAYLLGLLRDVTAVPALIELLEVRGLGDVAEDALAEITKQRLDGNARRWRAWWLRNERRPRLAWLVEGLGGSDAGLRRSAADELRALTGLDLGYDEDAPKRAREEARQRWVRWWQDEEQRLTASPRA
jgi:HEAT repeat protein